MDPIHMERLSFTTVSMDVDLKMERRWLWSRVPEAETGRATSHRAIVRIGQDFPTEEIK